MSRTTSSEPTVAQDRVVEIPHSGFAALMSPGLVPDTTRQASRAVNQDFYDTLWSTSSVTSPERFNTWPLLSQLAASAPARLEVGAGLRPRLPIEGTSFVDISRPAVSSLKARGGRAMLGEITALPFPDSSFDLVCAFDIIEHVEDDRLAFRELTRVAKDQGTVIVSVPLHAGRWSAFDALVGHVRRYEPFDLLAILGEHALVLEQSAMFGMQPRNGWLLDLAVWSLTHKRAQAMRWYNGLFLPLGLFLQRPLVWGPGLIDVTNVDEVLLVCQRDGRRARAVCAEGVRSGAVEALDVGKGNRA